ncbi:MAG: FAD-dependent monooxygenase [Nitrosomonas sp.]|jgi:2-octaprenyl-6-methoxyphenol hydroxylase|nr:FAD-dependent monooxygenase [Nitrosomonas sp.]
MSDKNYDIAIIGGGPVGMALALALRLSGVSILLLEARGLPEKVDDIRPLALSHGSYLILNRLGAWRKLSRSTLINTIHISNKGYLGRTVLRTQDADVNALGHVVNYFDLFHALFETTLETQTDYQTGAIVNTFSTDEQLGYLSYTQSDGTEKKISAKLLILADGGRLGNLIEDISYQTAEYDQWAITANIQAETRQTGIAYERFTSDGPIALLPSGDDFSLVWTASTEAAKEILMLPDEQFLERLHDHFGDRLGKFVHTGKRSGFPLVLKYATSNISQRIALVGNAAQTLHPVAGQGFNLGLRDAYELAQIIQDTLSEHKEIGTPGMLKQFREKRRLDSSGGRAFTDTLVKLFSNDIPLVRHLCGASLIVLDNLPFIKRFVARRMIFGARG